jgi:hypothetical protein
MCDAFYILKGGKMGPDQGTNATGSPPDFLTLTNALRSGVEERETSGGPASVAVLGTTAAIGMATSPGDGQEPSAWELKMDAPRWSLMSPGRQQAILALTGIAMFLLFFLTIFLFGFMVNKRTDLSTAATIGMIVGGCLALVGLAAVATAGLRGQVFHLQAKAGPRKSDQSPSKPAPNAKSDDSSTEDGSTSGDSAGSPTHSSNPVKGASKDPKSTISPKVVSGGLAGAASTAFWTIAAATFWKHTITAPTTVAVLAGSTTTILSTAAAYLRSDELRVAQLFSHRDLT